MAEKRFEPPSLDGRHLYLRAVAPSDYPLLQMFETSSDVAPRWRFRGSTPSPEQWAQTTFGGVLAQFLVVARADDEPIGLVTSFQASFQDGHAHVAAAKLEPQRRSPLMLLGFGIFVRYLFACWNFHKLYMELPEYNYPQFASGADRFFTLEGRLRDHFFFDGERWDQLILAIYREVWEERSEAILRVEAP